MIDSSVLTEGLKLQGAPARIRGCPREVLPQFLSDNGFKVGAEIGVHKGEFTIKFCEAGIAMFAIDPWAALTGQGRSQQSQERQDFLYGHALRFLHQYTKTSRCRVIRKASMEAIKEFNAGSLDFVYIDGNHEFPYVAQDIYEWSKIVRKGGIISGHDYFNTAISASNVLCHVKSIVDAYTKLYEITNWWTFGNRNYPSWMWINR